MGLKNIFVNMAILALIVFSMMSFFFITERDNSVNNTLGSNDLINKTYGNLLNNLSSVRSQSQIVSSNFENNTPISSFGEVEVTSIFSTTNTLKTLTVGLWNVMIVLPAGLLGISPIVFGSVGAILILLIIMGIWAGWKAGLFGGQN